MKGKPLHFEAIVSSNDFYAFGKKGIEESSRIGGFDVGIIDFASGEGSGQAPMKQFR